MTTNNCSGEYIPTYGMTAAVEVLQEVEAAFECQDESLSKVLLLSSLFVYKL